MITEIPLSEAATLGGYASTAHIRRACAAGQIEGARKLGPVWVVDRAAFLAWADARGLWGRGQKRGQRRGVQS